MAGSARVVTGELEQALWTNQVQSPWAGHGAVVRCGWLPARLAEIATLTAEVRRIARRVTLTGRVGIGAGLFRIDEDTDTQSQAAVVDRLRSSAWVGNVVVLRGSPELKEHVDVWGPPTGAIAATRALKQMFDPAGILNAGRGPL
jgi:FAD/FMN-containing dehydrogenase